MITLIRVFVYGDEKQTSKPKRKRSNQQQSQLPKTENSYKKGRTMNPLTQFKNTHNPATTDRTWRSLCFALLPSPALAERCDGLERRLRCGHVFSAFPPGGWHRPECSVKHGDGQGSSPRRDPGDSANVSSRTARTFRSRTPPVACYRRRRYRVLSDSVSTVPALSHSQAAVLDMLPPEYINPQ